MEDSPTDIQATQPHPPSTVSIKNQNRNMSRNERADSSAMNESPAVMFNTGVSTFAKKHDVHLFGAQEVCFLLILEQKECGVVSHCRPNQIEQFVTQPNLFPNAEVISSR